MQINNKCPQCKRDVESGVRFCPWCGTQIPDVLSVSNETAATAEVITPNITADSGKKEEKIKFTLMEKAYIGMGIVLVIMFIGWCGKTFVNSFKENYNELKETDPVIQSLDRGIKRAKEKNKEKEEADDKAKFIERCHEIAEDLFDDLKPFDPSLTREFDINDVEDVGIMDAVDSLGNVEEDVRAFLVYFPIKLIFGFREDLELELPMLIFDLEDGLWMPDMWTVGNSNAKMDSAFNEILVALFEDVDFAWDEFNGVYEDDTTFNAKGNQPKNFLEYYLLRMYKIDLMDGDDLVARNLYSYIYAEGLELLESSYFYNDDDFGKYY